VVYTDTMHSKHHTLQTLFLLVGSVIALTAGSLFLWAAQIRLPQFDVIEERKVEQSTKIYDRTGEKLLYDLHESAQRTIVPFDQIPRHLKNAAVAIEDAEFYQHKGIKLTSIIRAVFANIVSVGFSQGGSTITQQVVKNSLLTREKSITRKLKEWILAVKLEKALSKEEILALYLNETPYGGAIYGVEEASREFFNKHAIDLTLAESAYLAALPQAPTYYSPYGEHTEDLEARKNLVLKRMEELGFITAEDRAAAEAEVITFNPRPDSRLKAPHFVFYIRSYLEEKYGSRALEEKGMKIITTLDYDLQEKAQEIITKGALANEETFNASNAAVVALDPKTGQILAMVGSRGYFDEGIDGNVNIALAKRQPGSSFKPFVYATAFAKGYTPDTVLFDLRTQFSTACKVDNMTSEGDCYSPGNYDGVFRGPVTIRNALAQSINVPAVKALYLAGIKDSLKTARDLGITTLVDASRYGLTLVLGGGEVTLLEMTSAYGTFANEGVRNPVTGILRIEDGNGNVLEEYAQKSFRVIDRNIALQITDILSDNNARSPAFGERSSLYFPGRAVAAKTGTTNDYRDAWILGYTPNLVVGAWAGNNDNTPMQKKVAGFIIAPMWHQVMEVALADRPSEWFASPQYNYEDRKPMMVGDWQSGGVHTILHWVDKDDPLGPAPNNPASDPQYKYWEYAVQRWAQGIR
jgi:1A family penicillin-binding protein